MINAGPVPADDLASFDERIDILARELELAIKWERPSIMLIIYGSARARAEAEARLEQGLAELGQKVARFPADRDVVSFLCKEQDCTDTIYFIEGPGWRREADRPAAVNLRRDVFLSRQARTVFWLTQNEAMDLAHYAPDFWALRHRVVEFADAPVAEERLEGGPEIAWQGIGEYAQELEDTEARISLRESLLTDLPEGQESTAIRANLLLTLGILNWRKGDQAKADELLREALGIAGQIGDNWFEAECFNAAALVKTDMGRIDEAIDAYKQAIRLAPEQIFAWNNLGNLCLRINRNDEAIVAFQKAIEYNPKDPVSWNGLGNVYAKIGYIDEAIAAYRKSIEFAPALSHPWSGMGDVYAAIGRVNEAIAAYRKAADLNKRSAAPWQRLSELFKKQGRAEEAIQACQAALAIDPEDGAIWHDLGTLHLEAEGYAEAAPAFLKAIDLEHGFGWAHSNLALCYARQEKYHEAIPLYLRGIELLEDARDKALSWNRLGEVYRRLNDYENAIIAYRMADALNPDSLPVHPALEPDEGPGLETDPAREIFGPDAEMGAQLSDEASVPAADPVSGGASMRLEAVPAAPGEGEIPPEDGRFEFIELEEGDVVSEDARLWNEKGNVHFKAGAYEEAIAAYNKATELDRAFGWPYSNLALTYLTLGNYAEAILLYQKSIDLLDSDKDKAISWNELGNAYRCIDDYNAAIAAYQKADELDPQMAGARDRYGNFQIEANSTSAQVWNDLGRLFFKTGSYDEAVRAYCQAIQLEPDFGWPYSNLALTLVYQGDYLPALPLYKRSLELFEDDKDRAIAWNRLGNAYRKLNDYAGANAAFQQAAKLNSGSNPILTRTRFSLLSNCTID